MSVATIEAIRDRVLTLVEAITPTSDVGVRFRRYRAEAGATFDEDMNKNPTGAHRRFIVRYRGTDATPDVSNTTEERVRAVLEVHVAYPQTQRYGGANALDRDDVIEQDWLKINYAVGMYGRANFSSTNDCVPLPAEKEIDRSSKVDFLVVRLTVEFSRSTT